MIHFNMIHATDFILGSVILFQAVVFHGIVPCVAPFICISFGDV